MIVDHDPLNRWAVAHLALLVEGQTRLADLVGSSPAWDLNHHLGVATVGDHRLQYCLLGKVRTHDNVWLWSWADDAAESDSIAVRRALPLREFGAESGLVEFIEPSWSVDGLVDLGMTPAMSLAAVACPQIMGGAVFSAGGEQDRLYGVITDPILTWQSPSAFTALQAISGALAYGVGAARDIIVVYATAHRIPITVAESVMTLDCGDDSSLEVSFDDHDQVCQMHVADTPQNRRVVPARGDWLNSCEWK